MKISKIVPAIVVSFTLGATASPGVAKQDSKAKGKATEKSTTKENSGRQAGELPSGLQKYMERKGELPSGLQKKTDEGHLTKGLEKGVKKLKTTTPN
jgi:hypothetical protein